jgi:hypothetical protein
VPFPAPQPLTYQAPPFPAAAQSLSPIEVQQQLAAARLSSAKVRRAASVAYADGWMIAICGVPTFLFGAMGGLSGISGIILGGALCIIAYIEFDGAKRFRRLDITAARRLGYNQLALAVVLIAYSLWSLYTSAHGGLAAELQANAPELGNMGTEIQDLMQTASRILYITLIAVAILAQGGTALYYFSREKYIKRYVEQTPPWIVTMQRSGTSL